MEFPVAGLQLQTSILEIFTYVGLAIQITVRTAGWCSSTAILLKK